MNVPSKYRPARRGIVPEWMALPRAKRRTMARIKDFTECIVRQRPLARSQRTSRKNYRLGSAAARQATD